MYCYHDYSIQLTILQHVLMFYLLFLYFLLASRIKKVKPPVEVNDEHIKGELRALILCTMWSLSIIIAS